MYILVSSISKTGLFSEAAGGGWVGFMRGFRTEVAWRTKSLGALNGEGPPFEEGQVSLKPAGSSVEGATRKLKDETPSWMRRKYSVTSLELTR